MNGKAKPPEGLSKSQRRMWRLLNRHGWKCYYCHKRLLLRDATRDHKIPKSKGGGGGYKNLVPCCQKCNEEKADKPVKKYQKELRERVNQKMKQNQKVTRTWESK